jgi:hypothetical protein
VKPIALHAFNPGQMTGEGNWTWLIRGRVPTLVDAGVGDPRHLEALVAALKGMGSRRSSPMDTPIMRRVLPAVQADARHAVSQDAVA